MSPIDASFSSSFRNRAIISGFSELGHNIDIVTVFPYDSSIVIDKFSIQKSVNIYRINELYQLKSSKSIRLRGGNSMLSILIRSIYHHFFPFDSTYFLLHKIQLNLLPRKKYDVIISSSDPKTSHLAAKRLIKLGLQTKHWIQYWGDPFTLDITSKLIYPNRVIMALERKILQNADRIIYVSPITLFKQKQLYKNISEKMAFLPIPYDKVKIYPETNNEIFTIGYFGFYLSSVRNIIPLYNAVKNSNCNIHLNIVGNSDLKLNNCHNVTVYSHTNNIEEFERSADLIVVVLNLRGGQIPGKLYHLAANNKPVLIILDGEYKDLISVYLEQFNRFILCENDESSIIDAIYKQLISKKKFTPSPQFNSKYISQQLLF